MWYDVFVVAVLIVCMVRGAVRGVIWQLAGIAGLVLCLVFAETVSAAVGPFVGLAEPLNQWVVLFGAYLIFSFISFGIARLVHGWLEQAQMTEFNRHLGAVFGLLKGVAICLVLTFFIVTLSPSARAMLQHSRSGYAAAIIMDRLHPIMPDKLHDALDEYIHQLDTPDMPLQHSHDQAHEHLHTGHDHPHGEHEATGSPFFPERTGPGGQPSSGVLDPFHWSGTGSEPGTVNLVDEIVKRIPSLNQEQARGIVNQAIHNTPPELQSELISELKAAAPHMVLTVARRWIDEVLAPTAPNPQPAPREPQGRDELIWDIAARLSTQPAKRTESAQQISAALEGLPDTVVLGVLQDWRSDLLGEGSDPDPRTTAGTHIDQRIIRQLTIQRISVYQLSRELQDRLRAAAQR